MSTANSDIARELEEIEDERDGLAATLARIESLNQEMIPGEIVWRISDGECPVSVWREHRGLSRENLAEAASVPLRAIERVESGEGEVGFLIMAEIARVLRVEMEMLLPVPPEGRAAR